jgi:hypothetical protein
MTPKSEGAKPAVSVEILGLRTVNEANAHEHWRKRARRVKAQRSLVTLALGAFGHRKPAFPLRVTLGRIAPRVMDTDNAIIALKSVRDAVAAWLEVDDGPSETRVEWAYASQRKGKDYGVSIAISSLPSPAEKEKATL